MSMPITYEDLTRLAREVHAARYDRVDERLAVAGIDLADAVLARDAEAAAAALTYHEQMRDLQQRAIDRLRLAQDAGAVVARP